jgi:hypothetical protein
MEDFEKLKVSKNMYQGGLIKNLYELKQLAIEGKSVVIEYKNCYKIVRPAAFALGFQLNYAINCNFYYTFRLEDITDIEFEEK